MVTIFEAILLGILQGITEWLPVSSSGHLVLVEHLLDLTVPVLFNVFLHIGTLLVVLLIYRKKIASLLQSLFDKSMKPERQMVLYVIIATLATALIGLIVKYYLYSFLNNITITAFGLLLTTILLWQSKDSSESAALDWKFALLIGAIQGLALFPGVSRSGTTIALALILGIKRNEAATFSFLILIPATIGALGLLMLDSPNFAVPTSSIIIGTLVAMIVGYGCLKLLLRIVQTKYFHQFAWYTLILGLAILLI